MEPSITLTRKNVIEQGKPRTNQILVLRPLSVDNEA